MCSEASCCLGVASVASSNGRETDLLQLSHTHTPDPCPFEWVSVRLQPKAPSKRLATTGTNCRLTVFAPLLSPAACMPCRPNPTATPTPTRQPRPRAAAGVEWAGRLCAQCGDGGAPAKEGEDWDGCGCGVCVFACVCGCL